MPKLKTKSALRALQGDCHRQSDGRPARQAPRHDQADQEADSSSFRGTRVLFKTDGDNIKKYFLPNA